MNAHLERAYLLFDQRRYTMAEQELGQSLAAAPNDARSLALLALCLLEQEKFTAATERAQQAVLQAPDESFSHHTLSRVWFERNDLNQAEEQVQAALAIDPHVPGYHVTLGLIHYRRCKWPLTLAAAEDALALDPDYGAAVTLRAEALRKLGRKDTARDHLHEQLARDPEDPYTHATLGWNYLEKGNREKAMEHFREALRLDPELDWAREGVVETLKAKSRFYRGLMRYFFWLSRFSPRAQFGLIMGLFLGYQVLMRTLAARPHLAPLFWTVVAAYGLFVWTTWFARPLSNLALLLHPFGRLALSRDDRRSGLAVGAAFAVAATAVLLTTLWDGHYALAVHTASAALTVMCAFATPAPWPRRGMLAYTVVILVMAATSITIVVFEAAILNASPPLHDVLVGVFRIIDRFMFWNPLISTLLPALLMQYQPRLR